MFKLDKITIFGLFFIIFGFSLLLVTSIRSVGSSTTPLNFGIALIILIALFITFNIIKRKKPVYDWYSPKRV